jgi:hypothetical protein
MKPRLVSAIVYILANSRDLGIWSAMSQIQVPAPLSQGVGYGVVIGVGLAFAAGKANDDILISKSVLIGRHDTCYESAEKDSGRRQFKCRDVSCK